MPINAAEVVWDTPGPIDPKSVQWDKGLTATRAAEVAGGAVAPVAAAAGLGGMVGGPAGAALAAGGLGAADLATTLYNLAAPRFGREPVRTPSEIVRGYLTPESFAPRTESEQLLAAGAEGAAGALGGAGMANVMARRAAPGLARNVLATMGERPLVQAGAGAGAAVAPVRAEQLGFEDPRALLGFSVVGGLAGGMGAASLQRSVEAASAAGQRGALALMGRPPTTEALKTRAAKSFDLATSLGVRYDPAAYKTFASGLTSSLKGYDPDFSKFADVKVAINKLKTLDSQPLTIERLHHAREMLGVLRTDNEKDVRRLAGILTDKLDGFITNRQNAVGANSPQAVDALMSGIKDYRMMSKSAEIERLIQRAKTTAGWREGREAESLESMFGSLARSDSRMRKFTPDEQAMIRQISEGQEGSRLATIASTFAPSRNPAMLATQALVGGYGYGHDDPYAFYGAAGAGLAGVGGRAIRNALARRAAANVAAMTRGAPTAVPFDTNFQSLALPIMAQGVNAMQK